MIARLAVGWLVVLAAGAGLSSGGSLVPIWQLNLARWNGHRTDLFPVDGISFSPDGTAVAFTSFEGTGEAAGARPSRQVLVAKIGATGDAVRSYANPSPGGTASWSPDGKFLFVNGALVNIDSGASCRVPGGFGFTARGELIGRVAGKARSPRTEIWFYGDDCRPVRQIATRENWRVQAYSPEKNLVLASTPGGEAVLISASDGSTVRRWQTGADTGHTGANGRFGDAGAAICGVARDVRDSAGELSARCWATEDGRLLARPPTDHAGGPVVTSSHSKRVVSLDFASIPVLGLVPGLNPKPYLGALVWDSSSGEKIVWWRPELQSFNRNAKGEARNKQPNSLALSPDGSLLAEGGGGKLIIYKIQP